MVDPIQSPKPWRRRGLAVLVAAVALGAGAVAVAYQRDMAQARTRIAGRSAMIDSPYGPIEYADVGAGQPVLLIHGSGGGFDQGLDFSDAIPRERFRVIAPSRFGYLASGFPDGASPELQADALAYLMRSLGIDRTLVFGGSAGALSAMQLALRHPQLCRGLILFVPAVYAPDRAANTSAAPPAVMGAVIRPMLASDFLFWAAIRAAPDQMTRLLLATDPALLKRASASERRRVRQALLHVLPVSARRRGLMLDSATAGDPPPFPAERIACPLLAISARDDLYGTDKAARHVASEVPGSRLILYGEGGHMLVGHDAEAWQAITRFAGENP